MRSLTVNALSRGAATSSHLVSEFLLLASKLFPFLVEATVATAVSTVATSVTTLAPALAAFTSTLTASPALAASAPPTALASMATMRSARGIQIVVAGEAILEWHATVWNLHHHHASLQVLHHGIRVIHGVWICGVIVVHEMVRAVGSSKRSAGILHHWLWIWTWIHQHVRA